MRERERVCGIMKERERVRVSGSMNERKRDSV